MSSPVKAAAAAAASGSADQLLETPSHASTTQDNRKEKKHDELPPSSNGSGGGGGGGSRKTTKKHAKKPSKEASIQKAGSCEADAQKSGVGSTLSAKNEQKEKKEKNFVTDTQLNEFVEFCARGELNALHQIPKEIDVNGWDSKGRTALTEACQNGHVKTVLLLLDYKADCNRANAHRVYPLLAALVKPSLEVLQLLLNHPELKLVRNDLSELDPLMLLSKDALNPLDSSVANEIIATILQHPHGDQLVYRKNKQGMTALHMAAMNGNAAMVEALLRNGANAQLLTRQGKSVINLIDEECLKIEKQAHPSKSNTLRGNANARGRGRGRGGGRGRGRGQDSLLQEAKSSQEEALIDEAAKAIVHCNISKEPEEEQEKEKDAPSACSQTHTTSKTRETTTATDRSAKDEAALVDPKMSNLLFCLLLVLKKTGYHPVFRKFGAHFIRCVPLRNHLIAQVGILSLLEEAVNIQEDANDLLHQDGEAILLDVMTAISNFYHATGKNYAALGCLWNEARRRDDTYYKNDVLAWKKVRPVLRMICHRNGVPVHFISNWTSILAELSDDAAMQTLPGFDKNLACRMECLAKGEKQTTMEELSLKILVDHVVLCGQRLLYGIFASDEDDEDEDDDSEEDLEQDRFLQYVNLLLTTVIPRLYAVPAILLESSAQNSFHLLPLFQYHLKPLHVLWSGLSCALNVMHEVIATPVRFAALVYVYTAISKLEKVYESYDVCHDSDLDLDSASTELLQLLEYCNSSFLYNPRGGKKNRRPFLQRMHEKLRALSSSSIEWLKMHKNGLNLLLRSDSFLLQTSLQPLLSVPGMVDVQRKAEYMSILSEDRRGELIVFMNRLDSVDTMDFIIQQILSAKKHLLGCEMSVRYVNEEGVGHGPVREFFDTVARELFAPTPLGKKAARDDPDPIEQEGGGEEGEERIQEKKPAAFEQGQGEQATEKNCVHQIASTWLEEARKVGKEPRGNNLNPNDARNQTSSLLSYRACLPLFEYTNASSQTYLNIRRMPLTKSPSTHHAPSLQPIRLQLFECVGRLLGLAIRHMQPLGISLPKGIWMFLCGKKDEIQWKDCCAYDPELVASLTQVLACDFTSSSLELFFETTERIVDEARGAIVTASIELVENGSELRVNNENKARYVDLVAKRFCFGLDVTPLVHMRKGLVDALEAKNMMLFEPEELQQLVGKRSFEVEDLKKHVVYGSGYSASSRVIRDFWQVVSEMDVMHQELLLLFWSGSRTAPMFGFAPQHTSAEEDRAWGIEKVGGQATQKCPQANTCDRRLFLPAYESMEVLRQKLLIALKFGSLGFDRM